MLATVICRVAPFITPQAITSMSRGNRESASGNLKGSMRDNYSEYGVEEYYRKVGATYRNPHFPGVRSCLFLWFNSWWTSERENAPPYDLVLFDMACGSGEVTLSFMEWWKLGRTTYDELLAHSTPNPVEWTAQVVTPRKETVKPCRPPPINSEHPRPIILAADPYTAEAYQSRTKLACATLSFRDIAEGRMPGKITEDVTTDLSSDPNTQPDDALPPEDKNKCIDMVICSFALHLIETPSELFALLWELSTRCRWLIILAPHKRPEIKDGWGWCKWDVESWSECAMSETRGELLQERVHCRVYRSLNV